MSAAFDFSALSPPFLRNLVDAHIFPANPEWTDSSLNRAEQIYAKILAQVRDTLKDSDKQSSHVMNGTAYPLLLSLALTQSNRLAFGMKWNHHHHQCRRTQFPLMTQGSAFVFIYSRLSV
jgi:hypothetical protein